ncbi:hypothetical protein ACKKBG_A15955 [Auxenochlorella protothecoides x Auxenochlorella symbiontica]
MASLTPADIPALHHVLMAAINQDPTTQKAAEAELLSVSARPGFCSCLVEILSTPDTDSSCRWMAVLQLKNIVLRHWRSILPGALSADEKAHLRSRMLGLLALEDPKLAVQVAVVISKIARVDYPKAWPDLFQTLLALLSEATSRHTEQRTLLVLHHVLKELASKRLQSDQRAFEAVAALLLGPLASRWSADTTALLALLSNPGGGPAPIYGSWLLGLKCLRRLLAYGFPSDARTLTCSSEVVAALPALLSALRALGLLQRDEAQEGTLKLLKALLHLQELHPWSFWPSCVLLPLLEWCVDWLAGPGRGAAAGAAARLPMLLLHQTLRCPSYRGASAALTLNLSARRQVEQQSSMAAEVRAGLEEFWGAEDRRPRLLRSLVLRYVPLTSEDLEEWAVGPEAFHHALMNVAWEESVRGCAENLALALFEGHRKELAPVAVGLLHAACASPDVLEREAAYRLVAVAAEELHGALDFPAWLHSTLLPEARGANLAAARPSPNPLRRAALLLPGHWLGELKSEDRMALHTTMLCALGRECDMAVRLAALVTLRALVDDWSFEHAEYTPFVASSFEAVGALLQDATELDTQLQAFDYLNTLIDRLREGVVPHAPGLMRLLPAVWSGPGAAPPLLCMQALGTLSRVLCALGLDSPAVHPALLPALHAALDPSADCGVHEDGLQTWLVALRCSPAGSAGAATGERKGAAVPLPLLGGEGRSRHDRALGHTEWRLWVLEATVPQERALVHCQPLVGGRGCHARPVSNVILYI